MICIHDHKDECASLMHIFEKILHIHRGTYKLLLENIRCCHDFVRPCFWQVSAAYLYIFFQMLFMKGANYIIFILLKLVDKLVDNTTLSGNTKTPCTKILGKLLGDVLSTSLLRICCSLPLVVL